MNDDDDLDANDPGDGSVVDEPDFPDEDGPCMGALCVNPHPMHTYRECVTVEMMEAQIEGGNG